MTWPIPTLPTTWANSSPQADVHPLAHNQLADAVNELAARSPAGRPLTQIPGTVFAGPFAGTYTKVATVVYPATPYQRLLTFGAKFLFEYALVAAEQMDVGVWWNGTDQYQFHRGIPGAHLQIQPFMLILIAAPNVGGTIELRAKSVSGTARNMVDGQAFGLAFDWRS